MNKYVASQNDLHSAYISMFLGTCTLPKHCLSSVISSIIVLSFINASLNVTLL